MSWDMIFQDTACDVQRFVGIAIALMWEVVSVSYDNSVAARWLWSSNMKIAWNSHIYINNVITIHCLPKQEITTLKTCWTFQITKPVCSHHSSHKDFNKIPKVINFYNVFVGTSFGWRHHPLGTYANVENSTSHGYPRYLVKTIHHSQKGHQIHLRSPQKNNKTHLVFFWWKVEETEIWRTKKNICGRKTT